MVENIKTVACKQILDQINELTSDDIKNNREIMYDICVVLKKKLKTLEEKEEWREYVLNNWGNCKKLRAKIDQDIKHDFYHRYALNWISFEAYLQFRDSNECFCGSCDTQ